jgi:hypothetical protein
VPEHDRLVEAEAEKQPLARPRDDVESLDLSRRGIAGEERGGVAARAWEVAPADAAERRDRADADPQVVATPPVREVVACPEIPAARFARVEAEVGGLVPAVPGGRQRLDDLLEVALHRLGLPGELVPVRVGEAGTRLRLELVAGEVLGLEHQSLGEVVLEIGGALAGDSVDEIERDVVESDITESVHGAADDIRARASLEHREQGPLEALHAKGNAIDALSIEQAGEARGDGLGIRLDRQLVGLRERVEQPRELGRGGERRRAAAEEDRLEAILQYAPLERVLGEQRVHVGAVCLLAADDGHEVAVAAAVRAERQVHVQVPHVAHAPAHRFRS